MNSNATDAHDAMCQTMYPCRSFVVDTHLTVLSCFNTFSGVFNIAINIFLIYGLWKLELLKTTSYKFILYLCISDCCVGLFTQPGLTALLMIKNHGNHCATEIVVQSMHTAFCQFSVIMILIITMDRFLHMNYLMRYSSYMTTMRAVALVILNISACIIIVILSVVASLNRFYFSLHTATLTINAIIIVVIFVVYSKTYFAIRKRVASFRFNENVPAITAGTAVVNTEPMTSLQLMKLERTRKRHHLNFARAMIFVLLTLAICYLPYFSVVTVVSYLRFKSKRSVKYEDTRVLVLYWSLQLVYINSALNAIIVILSSKQLRRFTSNFLRGRKTFIERTNLNKRNLTTIQKRNNRRKSRSYSF